MVKTKMVSGPLRRATKENTSGKAHEGDLFDQAQQLAQKVSSGLPCSFMGADFIAYAMCEVF
jgi:hypothetical protein